jgi:hypothetical protein
MNNALRLDGWETEVDPVTKRVSARYLPEPTSCPRHSRLCLMSHRHQIDSSMISSWLRSEANYENDKDVQKCRRANVQSC